MPREIATGKVNLAVVPDFTFLFMDGGISKGVATVQFGFNEAKDVCSYGFHMKESVEDIGAIIVKFEAVDVLKVNTEDLGSPDISGGVGLSWGKKGVVFMIIIAVKEILEAGAYVDIRLEVGGA